MASRIRIRVADVEVEFEGSEEFIRDQIPQLLEYVTKKEIHYNRSISIERNEGTRTSMPGELEDISINSLAQKVNSESGSDLVVAAAAYLTFSKKKDEFDRKQILQTMKDASHYYKKNYGKNLSRYIRTAVKNGRLLEKASGRYSLSATARQELEGILG